MQRGFRFRFRESHGLLVGMRTVDKIHLGFNSHEVGGADGVLDIKELTIWEAVALRALFHLPQELVSFVDAGQIIFRNCTDTYM